MTLLHGNCLETLTTLPDCSVDSIVTDPPYELGFMGKSWDNSGIAYNVKLWAECLRVLKPGGHLLAFSGSRTYHRMTVAIEDAGFEVRDQIMWLYGSGFPKSLNVGKAIDKAAGFIGETIGSETVDAGMQSGNLHAGRKQNIIEREIKSLSPEAQQWQGWGTALKPAHEPICVARKPLIGTVANNVLTYGTGALNIDGSRVEHSGDGIWGLTQNKDIGFGGGTAGNGYQTQKHPAGRWPANVIHDGSDEVLEGFPNEAGRYFYCSKASKSERNAGLEGLSKSNRYKKGGVGGTGGMRSVEDAIKAKPVANFHPTVKPLALMRYLVKLVTPPNGTVLDPFLGSGSTAVAAILEGFEWIGCEMTEDYWPIIEARVAWAKNQPKPMFPLTECGEKL
jgi:site-specific DNA-methyltransferase (adenine-specific)